MSEDEFPPTEPEVPPKRVRASRAKPEEVVTLNSHVFRVRDDGSPWFSPVVEKITSKAERTVRTGQYESFAISTLLTAAPDWRFSMVENVSKLNTLVTDEVNRMATEIASQFEVNK